MNATVRRLNERISAGQTILISALFAMHTPTHLTPAAIDAMRGASALPVGAYANNPESTYLSPAEYAEHAGTWVVHGASLVGRCCGTAPAHVQAIKERLAASR